MSNLPLSKIVQTFVCFIFYGAITMVLIRSEHPPIPKPHPLLLQNLLLGTDRGYQELGSQFLAFRNNLPAKGTVSFVMDYAFSPYGSNIEQIYTAQSYLVPLVLNPNPGEPIGVFYCTTESIAQLKMLQFGYKPILPLRDGQTIAIKQP